MRVSISSQLVAFDLIILVRNYSRRTRTGGGSARALRLRIISLARRRIMRLDALNCYIFDLFALAAVLPRSLLGWSRLQKLRLHYIVLVLRLTVALRRFFYHTEGLSLLVKVLVD